MGVRVEFNQELTLRAFGTNSRKEEECLPEKLILGEIYPFLKEGQRAYNILGEIDVHKTEGNQNVSPPIAKVRIIEVTHFLEGGTVWTKGKYLVKEIYRRKK